MKTNRISLGALGLFTSLAGVTVYAQDDRSWIEVPIIINIMSVTTPGGEQVVVDPDLAKKAVQEASKIFKQARIKLTVVKVNRGDQNPVANAGDANHDGKFTTQELENARAEANDELLDTFKDENGDPTFMGNKIFFTVVPDASSPANLGHSEHNERAVFVRWVPTDPSKGQPKPEVATGTVIAHELAHSWTLGATHTVAAGENADSAGHTDVKTRPTNLMSPVAIPGTNQELTDDQETEIRFSAKANGVEHESENDTAFPQKTQQQKGGAQDGLGDQSGDPKQDLSNAYMFSSLSDAWVWFHLFFSDWFGDDVVMDLFLHWYFDTDNDIGTGIMISEFVGIDREIEVHIVGDGVFPLTVEAKVIDHALGGLETPLTPPVLEIEEFFFDDFPNSRVTEGDTRLSMRVDKALLNFAADSVPTHVVSQDAIIGEVDSMSFNYGRQFHALTPEVTADAVAVGLGQPVNFNGVGFAPNALATAFLDESPIGGNLTVMPDGTVSGSFTMCTLPDTGDSFYLTIVDDGDRFDFTALRVTFPHEDFEDYTNGIQLHGVEGWKGWDNDPAFSAPVTQAQARSSSQSVEVSGAADLVHEFCTDGGGVWSMSAWQYIPSNFDSLGGGQLAGSFFVMLNSYTDGGPHPAGNFSVQIQTDSNDGMLKVFHGDGLNTVPVPYDTDRWVKIQVIIDEEDDWTQVYYDDELVTEYTWTGGVIGNGSGALDIAAVDLVGNGSTSVYYDDLKLERGCGSSRSDDHDADGADTNTELRAGSNACDPDSDGDGLLDGFEIAHATCVDVLTSDATGDPDNDLLDNLGEQAAGSDPCDSDTDDDGIDDANDNCASQANPGQHDCDTNGVGDACVIAAGTANDCNTNVIDDECEAIGGGDFDASGQVDLADHAYLTDCISGPSAPPSPASSNCTNVCLDAFDADADNDIDLRDLAVFQTLFESG